MGNLPFSSNESLSEIKDWLSNKGFLRLADICSWDRSANWVGWSFPEILNYLIPQQNLLIVSLTGFALINCFYKDVCGQGTSGKYYVAQGYKALHLPLASCVPPVIWNSV